MSMSPLPTRKLWQWRPSKSLLSSAWKGSFFYRTPVMAPSVPPAIFCHMPVGYCCRRWINVANRLAARLIIDRFPYRQK